ncbi:DUF3231 family protein [Virgibacillus sp. MSP4-1]|uniref:DUF3231 family protein n=1 Tax=Virgibacillus sp. MSP4-1 TaxID=2700081 RepID=UPI0005C6AD3B|nr:DUF3231 family protein [Virgibacillus sp. MSP4-1]QHS23787.1 DUF3231 family protein [Virgibacillus sp. MSP4-1]
MLNILEAVTEHIKNYVDNEPKPPLHVGEVMDLWTAYTAFNEAQVLYQVGLNSTTNKDLKHAIESAYKSSKSDTKRLEKFLLQEGVPLPEVSSAKPPSDPNVIPEGVKLKDGEIANIISVKIASSITYCAQAMSKSVRSDVGLLFFEIQVNLMKFSEPFKNLMVNSGWINTPPKFTPPGRPGE